MRPKIVVVSVIAMAGVAVLALASAVTVFALMSQSPTEVEEAIQTAPIQLEVEHQPRVVEPAIQTEHVSYAGDHGCPYQEAKMQQVQAVPANTVEGELLTQASP